ncbi:hypothetical protein Hamer_G019811, partial [Homarus americanus]
MWPGRVLTSGRATRQGKGRRGQCGSGGLSNTRPGHPPAADLHILQTAEHLCRIPLAWARTRWRSLVTVENQLAFTCGPSPVDLHLWTFTCGPLPVDLHLWTFTCGPSLLQVIQPLNEEQVCGG